MTRLPTACPKPLKRKTLARKPVKKVNRARKASEFARAYHSAERVGFVKSLPCVACGVVGFSENAHVASGGAGRKADASQIVPLCGPRLLPTFVSRTTAEWGCHRILHALGRKTFEAIQGINLDVQAEIVERRWQDHVRASGAVSGGGQ